MKDIAVNALSRRSMRPWPCPGLGDRALIMTFLANYIKQHDTPVTLHTNTVQNANKRYNKWKEIASLVEGVTVQRHDVRPLPDDQWLNHLRMKGYFDVDLYWFTETPTEFANILIHDYLKESPKLEAPKCEVDLPDKYLVEQWDSTDPKRRCSPRQKKQIRDMFLEQGYELITVGGEAKYNDAKYSLEHIAYLMQHSDGFVGVNSGMFCLAHMYTDFDKIHFYGKMGQDHVDWFSKLCNFNYGIEEFESEHESNQI